MPIKTLVQQKSGRTIGRIRTGVMVPTGDKGKMRPSKLDTFRFTCASPNVAATVARAFGGEVRRATLANEDETWEVISSVSELPVMVPPGDAVISQWYEMWSGGGCQRRCDGITETMNKTPCVCPADIEARLEAAAKGAACKATTRLNVILPDVMDLGTWMLESHGFYAAIELSGAAELLGAAREQGVIIPATLRLEQRSVKRGGKTNKFAVPVLEVGATLRELTALSTGRGLAAALPPPPALALAAAPAPAGYERASQVVMAEIRQRIEALSVEAKADLTTWWNTEKQAQRIHPLPTLAKAEVTKVTAKLYELESVIGSPSPVEAWDDDTVVDAEIVPDEEPF